MKNLLASDKKNIWHPFTPLQGTTDPILIQSAEGIYLHTDDGRKIVDAVSSWWVNLHGHSNRQIAKAVATQAAQLEHVIFAGFTHEPAITLSENLKKILPPDHEKIFFSDDGSTAVEVSLKMALQYWHNKNISKKKIIAIQGAYHGDTFGSMSVADRSLFTKPFASYLFDTLFIDFPGKQNEENAFQQFKSFADNEDVAAFIFEPLVQGAGGMRIYSTQILDRLLAYARKKDIVCIADEVFTGFGRTGKMFACDHLTSRPDIIAMSKGITGGTLPLGATSCSKKIVEAFESDDLAKTFFHGHSYTANPLACAAANASFELLMHPDCQRNIDRITREQAMFSNKLKNHPRINEARSLGTLLSLELATGGETSYTNETRKKIYSHFLSKNILLRPLGNVIYVLPPYVITSGELSFVHQAIEEFVDTL